MDEESEHDLYIGTLMVLRQADAKCSDIPHTGSMRRLLLLAMLGTTAIPPSLAQNAPASAAHPARLRPLTVREGRAIVQETSWVEDTGEREPDCSHLVHDIYEQAGYSYPYASSRDLYAGGENFVRVRAAHPGDLIVWRGHVGIVVNPREHTFFSSVNSGLRIEYYNSTYWRARGVPRFYRYLTSGPAKVTTTQRASRRPEEGEGASANGVRAAQEQPTLESVKTAASEPSAPRLETTPPSAAPVARFESGVLRIFKKKPSATDVLAALAEQNRNSGEILRAGNLEQLGRHTIVYRDLRVTGAEFTGKRGNAQVEIDCIAELTSEGMAPLRDGEQFQLEFQRTKKDWTLLPADETIYVPRDIAVHILAARLASLTGDAAASADKDRQQAQIVRFLNLLVPETSR